MMATSTSGIYKIHCSADDRTYIGRSVHIERRWTEHRRNLRAGVHRNSFMQAAWNLHGESSFSFEVLEIVDASQLQQREQFLLNALFADGRPFNLRRDACGGADHTPDQLEKMSSRRKELNAEMWEKRRESGWKMSEEAKAQLSSKAAGKKQSDSSREKRSESMKKNLESRGGQWNKGKRLSDSDKKKKSESLKAYWRAKKLEKSGDNHS